MQLRKEFKCNVFSQCKIEFGANCLAILWNFSDFLEKYWFSLCESALENQLFAIGNGTVPFRIRKAFIHLRYYYYYYKCMFFAFGIGRFAPLIKRS